MDVYFDTNVYGRLYRLDDGIRQADLHQLTQAVQSGALRIFTSYAVIEETNVARLRHLDETNGRFELIGVLCVQDPMIKHHSELIGSDIRAYANGEDPPTKFQARYPGLDDVFWDHTQKQYTELDPYARETLATVTAYAEDLDRSFNERVRPLAAKAKRAKRQQPFAEYWEEMSEPWAEGGRC